MSTMLGLQSGNLLRKAAAPRRQESAHIAAHGEHLSVNLGEASQHCQFLLVPCDRALLAMAKAILLNR